jgi:chaperonin GroEL
LTLNSVEPTEQLPWPYNTYFLKSHPSQGQLVLSETALDIVVGGMLVAQKPVARAIGPHGMHTSFNNEIGSPTAERSGKRILQKLKSANPLENRGFIELANITREMSEQVGDFSKTAVLLECAILEASRPLLATHSPLALIQGIDLSLRAILAFIDSQRRETKSEDLMAVAVTAANGSQSSAKPVVEAMKRVGRSGLIYVEPGSGAASTLEVREGMEFDRGYLSAYFVTDAQRSECILEAPLVLLHEARISSLADILPLLEQIAKIGKPLLIIAEDVEGEALSTLVQNKLRGTLQCAAVKSPGYADRRVSTYEQQQSARPGLAISFGTRWRH